MTHPDFEKLTGIEAIRYQLLEKYHLYFERPEMTPGTEKIAEDEIRAAEVLFSDYGYVISTKLKNRIAGYSRESFSDFTRSLVRALRSLCDIYDDFAPLYYDFPDNIPDDMEAEWAKRVLSEFRDPDQPCPYCGASGSTTVLEPCHHVVCGKCFDLSKFGACPVCQRAVDNAPVPEVRPLGSEKVIFKRIDLGEDIEAACRREIEVFCRASQPMAKIDASLLQNICAVYGRTVLTWLLPQIVLRENTAVIFGTLLKNGALTGRTDIVKIYIGTATDVLRMIAVMSGHPASLSPAAARKAVTVHDIKSIPALPIPQNLREKLLKTYPDQSSIPEQGVNVSVFYRARTYKICRLARPMRHFIMALLESFPEQNLIEDMLRRRAEWVHIGGTSLHPGEFGSRYPKVQKAFAVIRRKSPDGVKAPKFQTWNAEFESAMKDGDIARAQKLVEKRPGELGRHLDWLMRTACPESPDLVDSLLDTVKTGCTDTGQKLETASTFSKQLGTVASGIGMTFGRLFRTIGEAVKTGAAPDDLTAWIIPRLSGCPTPMLATLLQHLSMRAKPLAVRIFTPKSTVSARYFTPDSRRPIPDAVTVPVCGAVRTELLKRFGRLAHYESCIVDESLKTMPMPHGEQMNAASGAKLAIGTTLDMPETDAETIRLFLHWCQLEKGGRADLDLSVIFYDADWNVVTKCCYFENTAKINDAVIAVHSGDRQDAPYPDGAAEYIDIDRRRAGSSGARYAAASVMCYNDIRFEQLERAFTGLMYRHDTGAAYFDPRTVRFKFALSGALRCCIPFVFDIAHERVIITDTFLTTDDGNINTLTESKKLAALLRNVLLYDAPHPSRYTAALLHAAARAASVIIRRSDGKSAHFKRKNDESEAEFYLRMCQNHNDGIYPPIQPAETTPAIPQLAFLTCGDMLFSPDSETCIVFPEKSAGTVDWARLLDN